MPAMKQPPSSSSKHASQRIKAMPASITPLSSITNEEVQAGRRVSIVALCSDIQTPIRTKGTDYKMTLKLFDFSTQHDANVSFVIFRPSAEDMPQIDHSNDVVLILYAKVQKYQGELSLICNRDTGIYVYSGPSIPKPPNSAKSSLVPGKKQPCREPTDEEHEYVSRLLYRIDPNVIPLQEKLDEAMTRSANVRAKFSNLAGITANNFFDMIVRVVKDPFPSGERVTMWVTDYTENSAFFKHSWKSAQEIERHDDEFGYMDNFSTGTQRSWPGPYGQRALQMSCYDEHATLITEELKLKAGDWVCLRNVQVKYGANLQNLEGYLRGDHSAHEGKVQVSKLTTDGQPENISPLLKEALRRMREYEKQCKTQMREIKGEVNGQGTKRKAGNSKQKKSKVRRNEERARARLQEAEDAARRLRQGSEVPSSHEVQVDLNEHVRCEHPERSTSLLADILKPTSHTSTVDGMDITFQLPFINAKHRAHVRVTDFRPNRLEDFAAGRKKVDYDILSDYEDDSSCDSSLTSESEDDALDRRRNSRRIWEWRFALRLEDAAAPEGTEPASLWAVVDNNSAQLLLGLDATDLRRDNQTLEALREKMFVLWGDLEEKKIELRRKKYPKGGKRLVLEKPPLDASSDVEVSSPRKKPRSAHDQAVEHDCAAPPSSQIRNKAFTCCLQQYGVKVIAETSDEADVSDGRHKWERMFGMFGAKICG